MQPIDVFEPANELTFEPQNYLLANEDLKKAKVDPTEHFKEFGHSEGRQQLSRDFFDVARRKEKLDRFRHILSFEPNQSEFPISYGADHFRLEDYQSESANDGFDPFVQEVAKNPDKFYLDLGCGLRRQVYQNCLYVEVYPSISADLIVSGDCTYPIRSGVLDGIGCFAVLEHVQKPWVVVDEIHRMLKPGGVVYIDWPFLQPIHGFPSENGGAKLGHGSGGTVPLRAE